MTVRELTDVFDLVVVLGRPVESAAATLGLTVGEVAVAADYTRNLARS